MYNIDMKTIYGFLQTTRYMKSLIVGLFLFLISGSLYYGVGALFFLMFSFVFNDWVDAVKDMVGHSNRAIPSGKLTRRQTFYISIVLLIMGVGWVILFLNKYILGFAIIYSFSIIYSLLLKPNIPILATPIWSLTIAILFLQSFSQNPTIYFAVTIIIYAYELLLDYRDREADKKFCRTSTLANILGKNSYIVSVALFFVGIILFVQALT